MGGSELVGINVDEQGIEGPEAGDEASPAPEAVVGDVGVPMAGELGDGEGHIPRPR